MWPKFWKASCLVLVGYLSVLAMGILVAFVVIPVLQTAWGGFCLIRLAQLLRRGAHLRTAPAPDRESFGFALGGAVSSFGLFLLLAQVPIRFR